MPSTEFLLYLIIVIFVVFVIITYYKDKGTDNIEKADNVQYKYIPVYASDNDDNRSTSSNVSEKDLLKIYNQSKRKYDYIRDNDEIDVYNRQERRPGSMGSEISQMEPGVGLMGPGVGLMGPGIGLMGPGAGLMGPGVGPNGSPIPAVDPLRKFDYDSVNDDFTPPFRRSYYDEYNYRLHPGMYPTYTRGPPGRFRKIGTLVAEGVSTNDGYKFLLLMGRQKWPSGGDYEYYALSPDADKRIKFYIDTRGKEISNDDIVRVPELDGYIYKYKEDKDLSPRYDPYLL